MKFYYDGIQLCNLENHKSSLNHSKIEENNLNAEEYQNREKDPLLIENSNDDMMSQNSPSQFNEEKRFNETHSVFKIPKENETHYPNFKSTLEPCNQNYIPNSKISLENCEKSKKASVSKKQKKIVVWCGNCDGCLKEHDCGTCKHCQNRKLRQKCVFRFCDWQLESSANKKVRQEKFKIEYLFLTPDLGMI